MPGQALGQKNTGFIIWIGLTYMTPSPPSLVTSTPSGTTLSTPENWRGGEKQFKAMLVMQYECQGLGTVKLLVGIRHKTLLKVQSCITAIEG